MRITLTTDAGQVLATFQLERFDLAALQAELQAAAGPVRDLGQEEGGEAICDFDLLGPVGG